MLPVRAIPTRSRRVHGLDKLTSSGVISALLAAGILEMRGIGGHPGWFWLFLLEGLLTVLLGIISLLYLPSSPTSTKSILCPKPWYTEREEVIMINVSRPSGRPDATTRY